MHTYTYHKLERLKGYHAIRNVFISGHSFMHSSMKIFYSYEQLNPETFLKCSVGVSKRNFRKAVQRNRIKRLLKEAYRLNKVSLLLFTQNNRLQFSVFILYTGKDLPAFNYLNEKMPVIIEKLIQKASEEITANT